MRLLVDSLMAVMLAALLAGILLKQQADEEARRNVETLRSNVRIIQQQVMLQAALERVPRNEYGFPATIDPAWFGGNVPRNPLFTSDDHPWLEVAGPHEVDLLHPTARTSAPDLDRVATFWYNPVRGVVRARVPYDLTDRRTIDTYNYVNGCSLDDLFAAAGARAARFAHELWALASAWTSERHDAPCSAAVPAVGG